jgi:hypothetical protein
MALLITIVLGDEVKVWIQRKPPNQRFPDMSENPTFATDDDCSVHLGRDDGTGQDASTDGDTRNRSIGRWGLYDQSCVQSLDEH